MPIAQKGSRKITLNKTTYRYKISHPRSTSTWRQSTHEINLEFLKIAGYYGLGDVMDTVFTVVVELNKNPVSRILMRYHSLLVDGFLGPEQITQITPKMVAALIQTALENGWKGNEKGDCKMEWIQKNTSSPRPVVLQIPGLNEEIGDYENIDRPVEIYIE